MFPIKHAYQAQKFYQKRGDVVVFAVMAHSPKAMPSAVDPCDACVVHVAPCFVNKGIPGFMISTQHETHLRTQA